LGHFQKLKNSDPTRWKRRNIADVKGTIYFPETRTKTSGVDKGLVSPLLRVSGTTVFGTLP